MCLSIPEEESRVLINGMDSQTGFNASLDKKQHLCNANLSLSDTRNSMRIESAEQDKYINILCDLLDESVKFNDSKQVIHCTGLDFVCIRS
jgi:hypothetical protein